MAPFTRDALSPRDSLSLFAQLIRGATPGKTVIRAPLSVMGDQNARGEEANRAYKTPPAAAITGAAITGASFAPHPPWPPLTASWSPPFCSR